MTRRTTAPAGRFITVLLLAFAPLAGGAGVAHADAGKVYTCSKAQEDNPQSALHAVDAGHCTETANPDPAKSRPDVVWTGDDGMIVMIWDCPSVTVTQETDGHLAVTGKECIRTHGTPAPSVPGWPSDPH
ncbi:hypothetical protein ACFWXK_38645 [Streptomyces sp. NPDC059070]|uniref:hypothetical protein n=1 Tax=Streptomyces sp. NPDC059070 TaxID=3346713 RepID=UPI00367B4247